MAYEISDAPSEQLIGPGPSAGPGRDSSGVSCGRCRWVCEWAPIISARLGGLHTPITNILLANSIISRPTILPQGFRVALHTPTVIKRQ